MLRTKIKKQGITVAYKDAALKKSLEANAASACIRNHSSYTIPDARKVL